jgi:hypothetical protein
MVTFYNYHTACTANATIDDIISKIYKLWCTSLQLSLYKWKYGIIGIIFMKFQIISIISDEITELIMLESEVISTVLNCEYNIVFLIDFK